MGVWHVEAELLYASRPVAVLVIDSHPETEGLLVVSQKNPSKQFSTLLRLEHGGDSTSCPCQLVDKL